MKILDINSLGGTCDRCGKGLTNVAVIEIAGKKQTVGLDCLNKVEAKDFDMTPHELVILKRDIGFAKRAIADLNKIKKLQAVGELKSKFEVNPRGDKIWYWWNPRMVEFSGESFDAGKWIWLGLAEQNTKGLYKEMWEIVTA